MTKFFSKFSHITVVVLIAGIYALLGKLGLSLAFVNVSASAVWPPSGFALAIILLLGTRVWPGIFLGALAVNLATTGHLASSLGIASGNTLEALLGAFFVQRFARGVCAFDRVRDIFKFVLLAAFVSTAVSATIGMVSLSLAGLAPSSHAKTIWLTWWLGDMASNLIVAPMVLLWATRPVPALNLARLKTMILLLAPTLIVGAIIFGNWSAANLANSPLIFLELPLFLWIGLRFSQRSTVTAAFLTCSMAIWGTLRGGGPFANADPNTSLLFLQLFMGILTLTALMMSAVVHERRQTEENRRELLNLAHKLNAADTPKVAGEIITRTAASLFGWDSCFIHLCNEKKELLYPIINIDTINHEKRPVKSVYQGTQPSPFLREVIEHGAKLILRKPPLEFRAEGIAFGDTSRPSGSLMFVPIRDGQKVVGILSIQSYALNAYDDADLAGLQSLANYCGGALERIRVTEDLRVAKEQLAAQASALETRVNERTAELKETIASLESFCYTIAHDLRAPLRSVQGFSRFLLDDYSDKFDAIGQDYCRRIAISAANMDNLIRDLLLYGQLAHKELPLESVELEQVVDGILLDLAEEIKSKEAHVDIQRPLATVAGNSTVVEQAVNNLISNALKFSVAGRALRVSIWSEPLNGKVRLFIQDNGIGIAPEYHERIFEVFQRLHNNTDFPGTGIGLAIVRKGIERMGGRVGVESQVQQGSKFWIELAKADDQKTYPGAALVKDQRD